MKFKSREQQAAVMMQYSGPRQRNRRFAVRKNTSTVRTGKVKTSKVNKPKISYIKYNFANYESQKAAFNRMKENGTYDPMDRTSLPRSKWTKEDMQWRLWQTKKASGMDPGLSPYEKQQQSKLKDPIKRPEPVKYAKIDGRMDLPLSALDTSKLEDKNSPESIRLAKLKKIQETMKADEKAYRLNDPKNILNNMDKVFASSDFSDEYAFRNLRIQYRPMAREDLCVLYESFKQGVPEKYKVTYENDPIKFLKQTNVHGSYIPQEKRDQNERLKQARRVQAERMFPDIVPWFIPITYDKEGEPEFAGQVKKYPDGTLKYSKHNSPGGAFHAVKFKIIKEDMGKVPSHELDEKMKAQVYGIMEIRYGRKWDDIVRTTSDKKEMIRKAKQENIISMVANSSFKAKDIKREKKFRKRWDKNKSE